MREQSRRAIIVGGARALSGAALLAAADLEALEGGMEKFALALAERHHIDCRPMMSHGLNGLRISLSVFNSEDEVDLLVEVLREVATGG